jgi:putative Holliday junction resolvase
VAEGFRRGVRLAVDWGDVRIGVAGCDPDGVLAYPLATVRATGNEIADLVSLIAAHHPIEVLVGLPKSLAGGEGPAAAEARQRALRLSSAAPVPVRLVDERLSTVTAAGRLRESGKRENQQRGSIDAAAAAVILEQALAVERTQGSPPGELVSAGPG